MITAPVNSALIQVSRFINLALAYDPVSLQQIAALEGQVMRVHCLQPDLTCMCKLQINVFNCLTIMMTPPDTSIKGSIVALTALLMRDQQPTNFYDSGIEVEGSTHLLQAYSRILKNLDIDWEAALAMLIGDIPAHLIGTTVRKTVKWRNHAFSRFVNALTEYSVEEAELLSDSSELDDFSRQVTLLRQDVDQLSVRIHKLHNQLPCPK